jgi:LAO/AO transport system kinase
LHNVSGPADVDSLAKSLRDGDRRALARAITLAESTRADHREQAETLLTAVLADTGAAVRVGISGTPGVGKSTFVEALGVKLIGAGHKVAVLAVDPTSRRSGGSILGDKTRMERLARDPAAFIRPSPSGYTLGGVARRTREAMLLCEAAGFDVVLVETVGVGQSETAVADMVDVFVLLLAPGGGDELQGIKRGIVEVADIVVVNKADGELAHAAEMAAAEYGAALGLLRSRWAGWRPQVLLCSALEGRGIDSVWDTVRAHRAALCESGEMEQLRRQQAVAWMWSELSGIVQDAVRADPAVEGLVGTLEAEVADGKCLPAAAARRLLETFRG